MGHYRIVNLAHDVDVSQNALLHTCARHLKATGHVSSSLSNGCMCINSCVLHIQYAQAAEVYDKVGDRKSLVALYVDTFQWDNVCCDILVHTPVMSVYVCVSSVCVIFVQAFELARKHSEFQVHLL